MVLFPDSYSSRGLTSQCSVPARGIRVDRERVADTAHYWLQSQAWVTAERISLLGWSNGAIATLWVVRPRAAAADNDNGADFHTAIAFYPGCRRLAETAWNARVPPSF